jgi:quinol monooxygenase YgiN
MPLVAITRMRLRSPRFLPAFFWHAMQTDRQIRSAPGCLASDTRRADDGAFWTRTVWEDAAAMRAFVGSGAHRRVMPKLSHWCDEASYTHWDQDGAALPTWEEAERRLTEQGHRSRLRHPSSAHLTNSHPPCPPLSQAKEGGEGADQALLSLTREGQRA